MRYFIKISHLKKLKELRADGYTSRCLINNEEIKNLPLTKTKLFINSYEFITEIKHMTTLEVLDICGASEIDDDQIQYLNLRILYADYNNKITKISHMTNLKELSIGSCSVTDDKLQNLNLRILIAFDNPNIRRISHMTNLT